MVTTTRVPLAFFPEKKTKAVTTYAIVLPYAFAFMKQSSTPFASLRCEGEGFFNLGSVLFRFVSFLSSSSLT
jgi:hypothetical protein